jgi:hypothetical protein
MSLKIPNPDDRFAIEDRAVNDELQGSAADVI